MTDIVLQINNDITKVVTIEEQSKVIIIGTGQRGPTGPQGPSGASTSGFNTLTAISISTATLAFADGTSMTTSSVGGGGVPYVGATANLNLSSYSLSATNLTAITVSATTLLAGNFQTSTAALQSQIGSLWNSKVPYTGATANVNLGNYSLSAASISSNSITSNTLTAKSNVQTPTIYVSSVYANNENTGIVINPNTTPVAGIDGISTWFNSEFVQFTDTSSSDVLLTLDRTGTLTAGSISTLAGRISITGDSVFQKDINRYGFLNQTDTSLNFDGLNTFTLSGVNAIPTWSYYDQGIKYTHSGNETVTLSASPSATTGFYYIYFENDTLTVSLSPWTLLDNRVPVATIYWNPTCTPNFLLGEERHSCLIDRRMHWFNHTTEGTRLTLLPTLSGYTLNSSVSSDKTFAITPATVADEDIITNIDNLADPNGIADGYLVLYRDSAATWKWKQSKMPFVYGTTGTGTVVEWNNGNGMTEGTTGTGSNQRWCNSYLALTTISGQGRHIILPGRGSYTSLNAAQAENPLTADYTGFPVNESIIVYQLTWNTASYTGDGKCQLNALPKAVSNTITNISTVGTGTHNTLAGLQGGDIGEYYHLTQAEYGSLASIVPYTGATTNVDLGTYSLSATNLSATKISFVDGTSMTTVPTGGTGSGVPYTGATANVNLGAYSLTSNTVSAITITASTVSATNSVSAGGLRIATITFGDGTIQTTAPVAGGGEGLPYVGATANVNLGAYSLSATNVTANTVSTGVILAGNLQTITASLDSRITGIASGTGSNLSKIQTLESITGTFNTEISGLETATGNLNSKDSALASGTGANALKISTLESITGTFNTKITGLESGTGSLQTQVGSLWNSKVPYTGATANVNLTTYGLTAGSISSGGGITGTTVSATTLLAGNFMSTTASFNTRISGVESGTGTLQTQVGSLWNSKIPYTGASANVNLTTYGLTAGSVSANAITGGSISGQTVSGGFIKVSSIVFGDNTTQTTASVPGSGDGLPYVGATANVNLGAYSLSGTNLSATKVSFIDGTSMTTAPTGGPGGSFTGGQVSSAYWVNLYDGGTASLSSITSNFNISNVHKFVVTGTTTTATLIGGSAGGRYLLMVTQGTTTGGVLFSPTASIRWSNGIAPALSTSSNVTDLISFVSDGTYYHGAYSTSQTTTNITYGNVSSTISISSASGLSCSKGAGTTATMAIVAPAGSYMTILAVGSVGGGTTRYPIKLLAPNLAEMHSVSIKQAAVTDTVPFSLLACTSLANGTNGNWIVWVNNTSSAEAINICATIYQNIKFN